MSLFITGLLITTICGLVAAYLLGMLPESVMRYLPSVGLGEGAGFVTAALCIVGACIGIVVMIVSLIP